MADEFGSDTPPATHGPVVVQRRSCLASLVGTLLTIIISGLLGAALAILFLWYGPMNVGLQLPDSTGRLGAIESAQQTAVVERTEMRATLNGLSDLRSSLEGLREQVQSLQSEVTARQTNLDDLRAQIQANFDSLLTLQRRLDELESVPAHAALSNRLADVELELATVSATLDRLRQALGAPAVQAPPATDTATPPPATARPTPEATPEATPEP
ncbi:MAG: hypothetical protein KatS3mg057_1121 [Herpetosiphonaceae bacterium]|nr:MAG: hypothetical protein KatS3mg057_1121 [Herpetosiphonaceae bacterium]